MKKYLITAKATTYFCTTIEANDLTAAKEIAKNNLQELEFEQIDTTQPNLIFVSVENV